ncbi:MAG: hypothetical protein ABL921_15580 [Pirellula sp.]
MSSIKDWGNPLERLIDSPASNALMAILLAQFFLSYFLIHLSGPIGHPLDFSLLASVGWLLWISPASFWRRTSFVIFALIYCWCRASNWIEFPILFSSFGYFLFAYSIASTLIGLRGWRNAQSLADESSTQLRFSISTLLLLMVTMAPLCLSWRINFEPSEFVEFFLATTGLAISVVMVQHAFTVSRRNFSWALLAGLSSLITITVVVFWRGVQTTPRNGLPIHAERDWYYGDYWGDILASFSITIFFVGLFAARAGWLIVEQQCALQRKNAFALPARNVQVPIGSRDAD